MQSIILVIYLISSLFVFSSSLFTEKIKSSLPSSLHRVINKNTNYLSRQIVRMSFYDIVEKDATGKDFSFENFKGKVVYGVNVASKCGYTASGYALLSKIAEMKDQGVEVAIFPCNQFGGQEPGSDGEIASFCALKGVKNANVFTKADVNGPNTRPTYKYLKEQGVLGGDVAWNFAGKFIVDKDGKVLPVKSEKEIESTIKKLIA